MFQLSEKLHAILVLGHIRESLIKGKFSLIFLSQENLISKNPWFNLAREVVLVKPT